ncbi:MAG: FAD-dependent thymidylate synthase [Calothrix sp. SM1_5_4]|nr:FAD-dependent thymidylate synthase [Calothrix sp. SM1_5_4]
MVGSHLPFITPADAVDEFGRSSSVELLIKRSVARCARVSYLNHDGTQSTVEQDIALHDRLVSAAPLHASPAEHQAMAVGDPNVKSGNFQGWVQYRKTLRDENVVEFVWPEDL